MNHYRNLDTESLLMRGEMLALNIQNEWYLEAHLGSDVIQQQVGNFLHAVLKRMQEHPNSQYKARLIDLIERLRRCEVWV